MINQDSLFWRSMERIMEMKYDESLVHHKSRHYLNFIANNECVITYFCNATQVGRTTVEHISSGMLGKRAPDFWSVPLSHDFHLSGEISLETVGSLKVQEIYNLPPWNHLAMLYLIRYLHEESPRKTGIKKVSAERQKIGDYHSAIHYAQKLAQIIMESNNRDVPSTINNI